MAERVELAPGDVVASLTASRVFSVLEPAELLALAPLFTALRFGAGEPVARRGEVDEHLWVVAEGAVGLEAEDPRGSPVPAAYRAFGDTLGERGVFLGDRRTTVAVALEPTVLLRAHRSSLLAVLGRSPDLFDRLVLDDAIRERLSLADLPVAARGEYRLALVRRHWTVLLRRMLLPAALLGILLVGAATVSALFTLGPGPSPAQALLLATAVLGVPVLLGLWSFYDYYQDVLIITNRRIVHVERTPFVDTRRFEAPLANVQDVSTITPGIVARLLGYGTLTVQTAAAGGQLVFRDVARPEALRGAIVRELDRARDQVRRERDEWVAEKVREAIGLAGQPPAGTPPEADEAAWAAEDAPEPFLALLADALVRVLGYFRPRMRAEENGVITWRKHWVVLLRSLLGPLLLLVLLWLAAWGLSHAGRPLPAPAWVLGAGLVFGWLVWQYENWRNDLYQVSDEHIVDLERLPFGFYEERRQASLAQVQDVRFRIPNPLATMLNYGSVTIQTAAEEGSFTFDRVLGPADVQAEIFRRIQEYHERRHREERDNRARDILDWLRAYHEITGRPPAP